MRAEVLYHPQSDHGGIMEDYAHDFARFKGKQMQLLSVDTKEGWDKAGVYGVTVYPAIIAIAQDGTILKLWQGLPLPLMNEVDSYLPNYDRELAAAELLSSTPSKV